MANDGVFKHIPPYDITRTKFNTYKHWSLAKENFLSGSVSYDDHISYLVAQQPNPSNYPGGIVDYTSIIGSNEVLNTSTENNYLGTPYYASAVWYSLKHIYYKTLDTYSSFTKDGISRHLYPTASVISIPQRYFGDKIKPGSVTINASGPTLSKYYRLPPPAPTSLYTLSSSYVLSNVSLSDDSNGNIVDLSISSSVATTNQQIHLGFNENTYTSNNNFTIPFTNFKYVASNVTYQSSDIVQSDLSNDSTTTITTPIGLCAKFNEDGYIQIHEEVPTPYSAQRLSPEYNEEFALSFWLFIDTHYATNTTPYNYIVTKRREGKTYVTIQNRVEYVEADLNTTRFPYEIRIASTGSAYTGNSSTILTALRSDGTNTPIVSASLNTGVSGSIYRDSLTRNAYHIVYQKTGSVMELYVDGNLQSSTVDTTAINFNNNCDLFIGNLGKKHGGFNGTVDEFFYFNRALQTDEITQLSTYDGCLNSNVVGNVFYEHGIIVVSDPRPRYNLLSYYNSSWNKIAYKRSASILTWPGGPGIFDNLDVSFRSKQPIEEIEVLCRLREDEFTFTTNPTILKDYRYSDVLDEITGSADWTPYVTSIGLYNDKADLIAVAKLSNPISKLTNADLNFIVRFDI